MCISLCCLYAVSYIPAIKPQPLIEPGAATPATPVPGLRRLPFGESQLHEYDAGQPRITMNNNEPWTVDHDHWIWHAQGPRLSPAMCCASDGWPRVSQMK